MVTSIFCTCGVHTLRQHYSVSIITKKYRLFSHVSVRLKSKLSEIIPVSIPAPRCCMSLGHTFVRFRRGGSATFAHRGKSARRRRIGSDCINRCKTSNLITCKDYDTQVNRFYYSRANCRISARSHRL